MKISKLLDCHDEPVQEEWRDMSSLISLVLDSIQERMDSKPNRLISGVTTGIPDLDKLTQGFRPGQLALLSTPSAIFSTQFALHIAMNVANREQLPVAYFCLGTSPKHLVRRMISALSRVDVGHLQSGNVSDYELHQTLECVKTVLNVPIFIDGTPFLGANDLKARIEQLSQDPRRRPSLIVIDDLNSIQLSSKYSNYLYSTLATQLRDLACSSGSSVLLLSERSHSDAVKMDAEVSFEWLMESFCHSSPNCLDLIIDAILTNNQSNNDRDDFELRIALNPDGERGVIKISMLKTGTLLY